MLWCDLYCIIIVSKVAVNCSVRWNRKCDLCFYIALSLCRWDSQRAPTDGRIPGEGSRTQPGCCSRLRPSPSSNWCHCNRDNIQTGRLSIMDVTGKHRPGLHQKSSVSAETYWGRCVSLHIAGVTIPRHQQISRNTFT